MTQTTEPEQRELNAKIVSKACLTYLWDPNDAIIQIPWNFHTAEHQM